MPAAMDGNELYIHFRVGAPKYLLDLNSVAHSGVVRFGPAGDVVEVRKTLTPLSR
jgi:hypothetical protein